MSKIKQNIIYVLYIVILMSPFLDSLTYLMRDIFHYNFSISTFLKPLLLGFMYLFLMGYLIFVKKERKVFMLSLPIILIYSLIHLIIIKNNFFDFSYGTFNDEVRKIIQICYVMLLLNIVNMLYNHKEEFNFDSKKLIKVLAISGVIYYCIFFLSLITNTSALSYSSGVKLGFQSWLNPSHLINHLGALTLPIVWYQYRETRNPLWLYFFGFMAFLAFYYIGTKSSTYSVIVILILLIGYELLKTIFRKDKHRLFGLAVLLLLLGGFIGTYKYSFTYQNTLILQSDLEDSAGIVSEKVDNTMDDVSKEDEKTGNDKRTEKKNLYLSKVQYSLKKLESLTIKHNLSGSDNRKNQAIYNATLYANLGWQYKLFGTGFANQPNYLYMENDILSLLFNFGIIPFVLLYVPILALLAYALLKMAGEFFKGKIFFFEKEYDLLISMLLLVILTITTGYLFLQTSLIIVYVFIYGECYYSLKNSGGDISLKLRLRKYLSKVARLKNKRKYDAEVKMRANTSIFDYQTLAQDMTLSYHELSKDNTFYGIADALREYANYKGTLDSYIEHGVNFSSSVYSKSSVYGLSNIITISERRIGILKNNYAKKSYAIGPYIHYARSLYDDKKFKQDKKKLGKVLLVFPSKSIEGVNHSFDSADFIAEINKIKKKIKADTVLVNVYYFDIQNGLHKNFEKAGFKIVTAGHKNDLNFTRRLKYIISLADYTMSNNIGTHIGYCLYMNKPHYVYKQEIAIKGKNVAKEFYEDRLKTYMESSEIIINAFSKFSLKVTEEQQKIYEEHWNPQSIKTKEELLTILTDQNYRNN